VLAELDFDRCYRAVESRDQRFDGWFVTAVTSTHIYCRPSCPALTPKRANVRFLPSAAAAQREGFRACLRCRPDAAPGSPDWDVRADVVGRAMRLIADGVVDRDGIPGLARRLGYTERHLHRMLTAEMGAGPLALARAQRAHTARTLIETTGLGLAEIAFAAGFGSVRQFNDTIREIYGRAPSQLRAATAQREDRSLRGPQSQANVGTAQREDRSLRGPQSQANVGTARSTDSAAGTITLRLPYRAPLHAPALFGFLAARAIPGVEIAASPGSGRLTADSAPLAAEAASYERALPLPHGDATVILTPRTGYVRATLRLTHVRDLAPAVARCRRLLDLDADPEAVDAVLAADPALAASVAAEPGVRLPRAADGFELAVRAIVGQQISVPAARKVLGRLVGSSAGGLVPFPTPEGVLALPDEAFGMPAARRRTIRALAGALADGDLLLDGGADRVETEERLLGIPGIGSWTARYILLRALGDPDIFLPTDVGVRRAAAALGLPDDPVALDDHAKRWAPWRSYAVIRLWRQQ
jgi:AraC family transcriptional regulator, regulatory protein of adaptative response / DNA-3-methyladenine glycosylase II